MYFRKFNSIIFVCILIVYFFSESFVVYGIVFILGIASFEIIKMFMLEGVTPGRVNYFVCIFVRTLFVYFVFLCCLHPCVWLCLFLSAWRMKRPRSWRPLQASTLGWAYRCATAAEGFWRFSDHGCWEVVCLALLHWRCASSFPACWFLQELLIVYIVIVFLYGL